MCSSATTQWLQRDQILPCCKGCGKRGRAGSGHIVNRFAFDHGFVKDLRWPRGIMGFMRAFLNLQEKFSTAIATFNFQKRFNFSTAIRYFSFQQQSPFSTSNYDFNFQPRFSFSTLNCNCNFQPRFSFSTLNCDCNFQPRFRLPTAIPTFKFQMLSTICIFNVRL